ncbi:MAG: PEP-CTERM sorting domain-containing protein [Pirellulales bacterium]|nr:PEP-CTERM sorting domain-containing protein [Pirellulales bacterium]
MRRHGKGWARRCGESALAGLLVITCFLAPAQSGPASQAALPTQGICAHRGASATHPENTLAAFREAIWQGAQQIEFDVATTADGELVIIHDSTVDRTTNGSGSVSSFTLSQLKQLDAGSWRGSRFTGERIPTLAETLAIMPDNVWLNVHMKGGYAASYQAAMEIFDQGREHQAFMAVTADQAAGARAAAAAVGKTILLCNMAGDRIGSEYVTETIEGGFQFLQFAGNSGVLPTPTDIQRLRDADVNSNYYGAGYLSGTLSTSKREFMRTLLVAGIGFPLIDDSVMGTAVAEEFAIMPTQPKFRDHIQNATLGANVIVNPGAEIWMNDYHNPTMASVPMVDPLLTRDRELVGWNDVVDVTNQPYGAADMPSVAAFPTEAFGRNAFVGGHITGTRWIQQTIDLTGLESLIDEGTIQYTLSAWLGGLVGQRDYTALTASFLDEEGQQLALGQVYSLDPSDWGGTTGMTYHEHSDLVPVGSRSISVQLWFNGQGNSVAHGMADNLSLVLSLTSPSANVPEPTTWLLAGTGGLGLLFMLNCRSRRSQALLKTPKARLIWHFRPSTPAISCFNHHGHPFLHRTRVSRCPARAARATGSLTGAGLWAESLRVLGDTPRVRRESRGFPSGPKASR